MGSYNTKQSQFNPNNCSPPRYPWVGEGPHIWQLNLISSPQFKQEWQWAQSCLIQVTTPAPLSPSLWWQSFTVALNQRLCPRKWLVVFFFNLKCFEFFFYVHECFACTVYVYCVNAVLMRAREALVLPWNWIYRGLWAIMWVLWIKAGSPAGTVFLTAEPSF